MVRNFMSCRKQLFCLLLTVLSVTCLFSQNPIITENALTGNPASEWDVSGAGSSTLQGFATDISVNKGERVNFKINTSTVFTYTVRIYRLGYYQGNGARLITTLPTVTGTVQPQPTTNTQTGLVDCGNWSISAFWDVPSTAVSGIYIAKLTRTSSSTTSSHIVFIVRDDASTSPLFFQTSDATWQAYNVYGGNSLYVGATSLPGGHAAKVSYNRPFQTRAGGGGGGASEDWLFNAEYPMIRFLERNGYNVSYTTNVDAARRGNLILNHKVFLSVGHDEYWSAEQRASVEAARNAGVHLAFFSGNEVYWKTRWENSVDGSNTPYRTLVCYKEGTLGENVCGNKCDPTTAWTGLWRSGCDFPSGGACKPENALTGQISWGSASSSITVPASYKNLRFWRNTSVATLGTGQTATFPSGTLGYEYNYEQYPDSYPSGRITLSSTSVNGNTHKLSLYRHSSGALVFGAGTVQWAWGLDNMHDRGNAAASVPMQQATVNLFADMGVQPGSLMSGLVAATASTDLAAPACVITSPANGATLTTGTPVTITGTATEAGGGVLVGVEVSINGGTTWQPATGTTSWTFSWTPTTAGTVNIRVRGFDDSGNMGVPGAVGSSSNINVTVTGATTTATTIFQPTAAAGTTLSTDGQPLDLGMKFRSTQSGHITGIRYYKAPGTTGIHVGSLWSSTGGTPLAQVVFNNETASGWQQALFTTPVAISANTTYIVSYYSPSGDYAVALSYFTQATINGNLRGLADGEDGPNGLYRYASSPGFPTNSYQSSNYWVDVVFSSSIGSDATPPAVSSVFPLSAATGMPITTSVSGTFTEALNPSTVTTTTFQLKNGSTVIPATVSASANQITLTPSAPLAFSTTYNVTITGGASGVKDLAGNALASNYTWSFTTVANSDLTAPTVSSVTPLNAATGIAATTNVTATFSETVNAATVTTTTFQLKNGATVIPATVSTASNKITLTPSVLLAYSTTYTVTITGGGSGVKDLAGNALASNYSWSFTTATSPPPTSSVFQPTDAPTGGLGSGGSAGTLGMKFKASVNGYVTGVRYYKGAGMTGTRTANLWNSAGSKLAEAVFANETASGWQQVLFTVPVLITANATYTVSYHTPSGQFMSTNPYFTQAVVNGPLRALANGEDGSNGVYVFSSTPAYPTNAYGTSNFWVDVLFAGDTGPDVSAPSISSVAPANMAASASVNAIITANFNEAINVSTVTASSFELRNAANTLVTAVVAANGSQATLTPSAALNYSTSYTATIKGGASGVKDVAGNPLVNDYTWTFTTSDPSSAPPTDGPGGPILVVSSATNPFSRYAVEILRAEGLNQFAAKDISQLTAADLNNYDVVVLGEVAVTAAQATLFTNWVNAGGTLIAFKPSTQLSSLLGITKVSGSLSEGYLLVNTTAGTPGAGIVGQTIQFHGAADLYTLNGATSIATLYSNATTATTNPAVTTRTVGANGGKAIAFTYDLSRSIVYTRQGNPAWAGQKRDGTAGPIRSDDMYFGGTSPDWVDFNKIAIPQADEQQRLLTNIILQSNLHRKPLPRFWFLPSGHKAAIVMTGDDHSQNGTPGQFNHFKTLGPNTAQDVADWKAIRGSSYIYNGTMTNAAAAAFQADGFEIALHFNTNCTDFTPLSMQNDLSSQLGSFASTYPGLSAPVTNRTHCIVWSDWATSAKVQLQNGIRLDANYYYWPAAWVQNRPGMFTGSGMPMRFADLDGSLIDCYQVTTQMTDEAQINYAAFANSLLDKAQGPEGYYGVFCANMHTDSSSHAGANAIIASAIAHQVPVVSSKQMLTWLDGRNNSFFSDHEWNDGQLTFSITALSAARNLQAMLPLNSESGPLASLTREGNPVSFTTQTIKGIQYAFFNVTTGSHAYVATYAVPNAAPVVTTQPASQSVCTGTSASFTSAASGHPVPTVQWQVSPDGISWSNIAGATATVYTFTPVIADNSKQYRAVWTNSQGTANSDTVILTVNEIPGAPSVNVVNNCGNSVLTASGFTGSLLWSNAETTPSITVTTAGNYTVTQTLNGCTSAAGSGTAAPLVSSTPAPVVAVVNNCGNSVLTASGFTGSLLWSNGATTPSITVAVAGAYTVTQTVGECTSPAGSGTAAPKAIPSTPTISAGGTTTLCSGGSVLLTASSATGNLWSTGATTQSITVSAAGNYTVTNTNAGGCSATSAPTAVTVNPAPAGTISSTTGTVCDNDFASVVFNATSGTGPYNVVINGTTYNNVSSGASIVTNITAGTSLWDNTVTPQVGNANDGQALELGMKFRTSVNGVIKSIRFYKGNSNDGGTYVLKLYQNSNQSLLASQTFTNTTASGWQTVNFTTPVAVVPGTTYVASFYTPAGNYTYTDNYFASARVNGALTGLANNTDGPNGVYRYGTGGGFPNSGYMSRSYWVDVVFVPSSGITLNLTSITDANNCAVTGSLGSVTLQSVSCTGLTVSSTQTAESPVAELSQAKQDIIVPGKLGMAQNRPNPFNSSTLVDIHIPKKERVKLSVYDVSGRLMKVLLDEVKEAGNYVVPVHRNNLSAGIYYYRLESGGEAVVRKMTIW